VNLFDLAAVLAAWGLLLSSPRLRTSRTLVVLGALTAAFVAAGLVGVPTSSIIRIVIAWIYLLTFLRYQYWLAGLSRMDDRIDSQLRRAMREVDVAHRRWTSSFARGDVPAARVAREATARGCEAAVGRVDRLARPSEQWQQTLSLVRDYFVALGNAAAATDRGDDASRGEGRDAALVALNEQVNRAWEAALRRPRPSIRLEPPKG
jgi:hypothetical protein